MSEKAAYFGAMAINMLYELGVFSENEVDNLPNMKDIEVIQLFNERLAQIKSGEISLANDPKNN